MSDISTATVHVADRELRIAAPTLYQLVGMTRYLLSWEIFRDDFSELIGDRAIDVGASMGAYSMMMALAFPDIQILSIEPSMYSFGFLEHNTRDFPNIRCLKKAVTNSLGSLTIGMPTEKEKNDSEQFPRSITRGNTGWISAHGYGDNFLEEVEAIPLDSVSDGATLIKIDVEGHEGYVLEGMSVTLQKRRPVVLMELRKKNRDRTSVSSEDLIKTMAHYRYACISWKGYDDSLFLPT